jgi:predicted nuclease of restriction endonuclease-like (RecB) superfamily
MPELSGFNRRGIYRMIQFYESYTSDSACFILWFSLQNPNVSPAATLLDEREIQHQKFVASVLTQVSWTNHLEIFSAVKIAEERLFYLLMCIKEKWKKLELRRQIQSAVFERTMLSETKETKLTKQLPANLFKDPYIFEFLDLPEDHSEKDLEKALIVNLQKFILEIGKDFAYMGNQYRLQVGNKDYYTDLLFYHRELRCLVLFELKIQEFEPEFLGKLNFYLEALDRDVKRNFENDSVGILLCKGKDTEVVEYAMARNTSPAMIAEYETKLIPKKILAQKLLQLVEILSKEEFG